MLQRKPGVTADRQPGAVSVRASAPVQAASLVGGAASSSAASRSALPDWQPKLGVGAKPAPRPRNGAFKCVRERHAPDIAPQYPPAPDSTMTFLKNGEGMRETNCMAYRERQKTPAL